uniref:Uncharacterized protein n=1 Tax=Anguilla anguilla TaxID=7936 RepID=A0A0E9T7F5_ANGAN
MATEIGESCFMSCQIVDLFESMNRLYPSLQSIIIGLHL